MSYSRYGEALQPINYQIAATADSTGSATFLFDAVALSNTWTGTLNCAGAPDTANFTALTGSSTFGQFKGSNSWGPLQLQGGDRLQVNASGLIPGVVYTMSLFGYCNTVSEPTLLYPQAYADTVSTSTQQLYIGQVLNTTIYGFTPITLATIPINPAYRSLYLMVQYVSGGSGSYYPENLNFLAVGNNTGFTYGFVNVPYAGGVVPQLEAIIRIPLVSAGDTSVILQADNAVGYGVYNIYYGADLANVDSAVYPEGEFDVTIANNAASNPVYVETVSGSTTAVSSVSGTVSTTVSGDVNVVPVAGSPLNVDNVGGLQVARITTTTTTPNQTLLPVASSGNATRIHSIAMLYSGTASTTPVQGIIVINGSDNFPITYPYQSTIFCNGLLTTQAIGVTPANSTSTAWIIRYDTIAIPTFV